MIHDGNFMAVRINGVKVEIINLPSEPREGYFRDVQLAIDGVVCFPFNIAARDLYHYRGKRRLEMLTRQAQSLIEAYGDVRTTKGLNAA